MSLRQYIPDTPPIPSGAGPTEKIGMAKIVPQEFQRIGSGSREPDAARRSGRAPAGSRTPSFGVSDEPSKSAATKSDDLPDDANRKIVRHDRGPGPGSE